MNLRIIQIGKTREPWIKAGVEEYLKRLQPFIKLEVLELSDTSLKIAGTPEAVKAKEAALILSKLEPEDYVILLDERGLDKTSLEFSGFLTNISDRKRVVFVIGGVYGTDPCLRKRADLMLRLSAMTFTHQMARLVLVEQIYRAMMISSGRSYHY